MLRRFTLNCENNVEFRPDRAFEILEATPTILRGMLGGLADDWTLRSADPDEWSAFDVVGHLVHGEKTDWIPRIRRVVEHGPSRPFEPFDRLAQFEESKGATLDDLLTRFETLRRQNLDTVRTMRISTEQWDLQGMHPALGLVTLRHLFATWAVHDLNHMSQICESLAKHYDEAVGPWKKYLPILDRSAIGA